MPEAPGRQTLQHPLPVPTHRRQEGIQLATVTGDLDGVEARRDVDDLARKMSAVRLISSRRAPNALTLTSISSRSMRRPLGDTH